MMVQNVQHEISNDSRMTLWKFHVVIRRRMNYYLIEFATDNLELSCLQPNSRLSLM